MDQSRSGVVPVTGGANALVVTVALYATDQFPKPDLQGVTAVQVKNEIIDATRPWFQHESHGAFAGYFALARGPVNVRTTNRNVCKGDWLAEIADQADKAVQLHEPHLKPTDFDAVIYYFGAVAPCTGVEAGWGEVSGRRIWLNGDHSARTAVHEFGHHLGLGHAGAQQCLSPAGAPVPLSTNCTTDEYGDLFSAMGGTVALTDEYSPFQQAELGWNQAWTSTAFAGDPPRTYFLTPVEDDAPPGTTQTLRLFDNAGEDLWLDYHRNRQGPSIGFDSYTSGLLVRRETNPLAPSPVLLYMNRELSNGGPGNTFRPNMLIGQSWTNPLGTMTITLNSADATGASVTIQSPPPPPPTDIAVPNLIGLQPNAAAAAIRAAGLAVGAVNRQIDCEDLSRVVGQSPGAGALVPPGFAVGYTYGTAPRNGCGTPN